MKWQKDFYEPKVLAVEFPVKVTDDELEGSEYEIIPKI